MEYQNYLDMDPVNYTSDELKNILNLLEIDYGQIISEWGDDLKALAKPDFDEYSFFGQRKLKKVANKYAGTLADITLLMEDIETEISKREKYAEEQRYMGTGKYKPEYTDKDEFLNKEDLRTLKHRQDLDANK